jgi:hypothetical protein
VVESSNAKLVGRVECAGGGQVWIDGTTLYVGHMDSPHGTSIFDVADPSAPRLLASLDIPAGWHSHKVRVADGIMLVNHECNKEGTPEFGGGLGIYDVSDPAKPRMITKWRTGGKGVHRFTFDGRYAYISPTADGYVGNFVMILDVKDPEKPVEVGRWWIPGQWTGGDEEYPWGDFPQPRCHHPMRLGDRLYVSYWHHGAYILDISDMSRPTVVSSLQTSPAFPVPTHTCLPIPHPLKGRKIMVVADEDVLKIRPAPPSFAWICDITDEKMPRTISTFQVPGLDADGAPQPAMTGCHQPSDRLFNGPTTLIPFAWFAQGLRVMDIKDPFAPREVAFYKPDPPPGHKRVTANDVTVDDRGLVYLVDRNGGVDIVELGNL